MDAKDLQIGLKSTAQKENIMAAIKRKIKMKMAVAGGGRKYIQSLILTGQAIYFERHQQLIE